MAELKKKITFFSRDVESKDLINPYSVADFDKFNKWQAEEFVFKFYDKETKDFWLYVWKGEFGLNRASGECPRTEKEIIDVNFGQTKFWEFNLNEMESYEDAIGWIHFLSMHGCQPKAITDFIRTINDHWKVYKNKPLCKHIFDPA